MKGTVNDQQRAQPPTSKKRLRLFHDVANPSEPLSRDRAESPAKEHNEPNQADWQNVKYYGQSPHEMVYSNHSPDEDFRSLMNRAKSNEINFTRDQQRNHGSPYQSDFSTSNHQPAEPVFRNIMHGAGSRQNAQPVAVNKPTIDDQGRPLGLPGPTLPSNVPRLEPDNSDFMTPHSIDDRAAYSSNRPNNLANLIMRDKPTFEKTVPKGHDAQGWGGPTPPQMARPNVRAGPAMMLNMSQNDSKGQVTSKPPLPRANSFHRPAVDLKSAQSFVPSAKVSSNPAVVARPGPNKFAPLDAKPDPPAGRAGFHTASTVPANFAQPPLSGASPHQFLSRDPVLQSAGRPYF